VGAAEQASTLARHNITVFPADVDAVITNAAGCGSGMKEYGLLLKGSDVSEAAQGLADRVVDVCAFLDALGLRSPPPPATAPLTVAYHDACHLAHAQGVRRQPRALLETIGNLNLVEPAEWELCCGSAGTYNVQRPGTAQDLGVRKARNLLDT